MFRKTACSAAALLAMAVSTPAFATNGMNLEGYGAKSHAMGGASMAFDTGNSAVMNNPATLGYMKEGTSEIGIGIRGLHPDIDLSYGPYKDSSSSTAFYMPSLSYMRRAGSVTWGAAVLSQGGMGAEYGPGSSIFSYGKAYSGAQVPLSGLTNRSEVGVGRVMFPVGLQVTENTSIGITADFVWASMDLQMDLDGDHFARFMAGNGGTVGGSMFETMHGMMLQGANPQITDINYARVDFSNGSPWIGSAVGYGTGFKLGFTQKFGKSVTVGGSFHSQTALGDLKSTNASMSFSTNLGVQSVTGQVKVKDFEWPATWGLGVAVTPNDRWLLAADVKCVDWSAVMDKFSMEFTADNTTANLGYAGKVLDMTMTQEWEDQTVWSFGAQYKATGKLALRGGASFSNNPVPNRYLNPLFPAIIENHYTCGFGYQLNDVSNVAAAFAWAPKVTETNGDGMEISHSQMNWSLNYTHKL